MVYYIGSMPVTPYLEHHGIQGQKWGNRRFQNEDGSLTEAGRARYGVASKRERRTLENLKKIKTDNKRMSRMSQRQRKRLDDDIDFYTKRTTGEVGKKNIVSRYLDSKRSMSFKERAGRNLAVSGVQNAIGIAKLSKLVDDGPLMLAGRAAIYTAKDAAARTVVSELYNRAVGRY